MQPSTIIHEQLKSAREARGEDLAALAHRVGMREVVLRAVEEGRFEDLPSGIYARAAIRAYATGVGHDPAATIAACEPFLRPMEDPVAALACLRGIRRPAPAVAALEGFARAASREPLSRVASAFRLNGSPAAPGSLHLLKPIAAAAIDATIVVSTLLAVVTATTIFCGMRASAFGSGSAAGFAGVGMLMGLAYFASVGGIAGATIGEQLAGAASRAPGRVRLHDIARRALHAATLDARTIVEMGAWVAATLRAQAQLHSSHSPSET